MDIDRKGGHPPAMLKVPEPTAKRGIWIFSAVVFLLVAVLSRVKVEAPGEWDPHVFARINAVINSTVSILLIAGFVTAKARNWPLHRAVMLGAIVLSVLFLVSYIAHHLFAGDTPFGGQGPVRIVYYCILASHILLAGLSLPFILITAYRALSADYARHRRIARRIWPVWLYVSVTGVVVYLMISPYY